MTRGVPPSGGPDDEDDEDDELATRPHRKIELPDAAELFEDTVDDDGAFENQLTPPPRFLQPPPEPTEEDQTRPVPLDDDDDGELG